MNEHAAEAGTDETATTLTVRLWASARAAAGQGELAWPVPTSRTLAALTAELGERYGAALARVLEGCSVLVDEQPVASRRPEQVLLTAGQIVDYLPPFAGG